MNYKQHIIRQGRFKCEALLCDGMKKFQLPGMQCLPFDKVSPGIVEIVPDHGMSKVIHVHPDLMCPAGRQSEGEERKI